MTCAVCAAHAQFSISPTGKKIQQAMRSDIRSDAQKVRDENHKPAE